MLMHADIEVSIIWTCIMGSGECIYDAAPRQHTKRL